MNESRKKNLPIRNLCKKVGMPVWMLAELLGISDNTLYRRLRHELPPEEQSAMIKLIETWAAENH